MKQLITTIKREKDYNYNIDKNGNVFKCSYNWFTDKYTLVTIAIILLSGMYYLQIKDMKTIESNFEQSCLNYIELRELWIRDNPGRNPTLEEVVSVRKEIVNDYYKNITIINESFLVKQEVNNTNSE